MKIKADTDKCSKLLSYEVGSQASDLSQQKLSCYESGGGFGHDRDNTIVVCPINNLSNKRNKNCGIRVKFILSDILKLIFYKYKN